MEYINKVITINQLQEGDEVIVRGLDLNYMKVIRPPKQQSKIYTGFSGNVTNYQTWTAGKCKRMNGTIFSNKPQWDKEVYFDFEHKSIWLVKRENK